MHHQSILGVNLEGVFQNQIGYNICSSNTNKDRGYLLRLLQNFENKISFLNGIIDAHCTGSDTGGCYIIVCDRREKVSKSQYNYKEEVIHSHSNYF